MLVKGKNEPLTLTWCNLPLLAYYVLRIKTVHKYQWSLYIFPSTQTLCR